MTQQLRADRQATERGGHGMLIALTDMRNTPRVFWSEPNKNSYVATADGRIVSINGIGEIRWMVEEWNRDAESEAARAYFLVPAGTTPPAPEPEPQDEPAAPGDERALWRVAIRTEPPDAASRRKYKAWVSEFYVLAFTAEYAKALALAEWGLGRIDRPTLLNVIAGKLGRCIDAGGYRSETVSRQDLRTVPSARLIDAARRLLERDEQAEEAAEKAQALAEAGRIAVTKLARQT